MKSSIIISNDENNFLLDQLKIEGITAITGIDSLNKDDVLILNKPNKPEEKISKLVKEGLVVIAIKPDADFISQFLSIKTIETLEQAYLKISNVKCQIFRVDKYSTPNFPSIIQKNIGEGKIFIIPFDLNYTIFHLNEGEDITFDKDKDGVLRVGDGRVTDKDKNLIPQADILRGLLVELIECSLTAPLPRAWYFPAKKRSAIIFTHDSDNMGSKHIQQINDLDIKNSIKSTTFVRPFDGSPKIWRKFKSLNLDLQLHATYLYFPRFPVFFRKITGKLTANRLFVFFQKALFYMQKPLMELLASKKMIGVRNHGLVWNKLADHPAWFSSKKIEFDSTLGCDREIGYGYGCATGLPFFLREPKTYKSLDVLEFQDHIMEDPIIRKYNSDFELVKKLAHDFIDSSIGQYPSIITTDFHHYHLISHPKHNAIMELYLDTINYAKKQDLLIETMSFFNDFWRKRLQASITNIEFENKNKICRFDLISENKINNFTLAIPKMFGKLAVKNIAFNNKIVTNLSQIKLGSKELVLAEINIENPKNSVSVYYC